VKWIVTGLKEKKWLVLIRPSLAGFESTADIGPEFEAESVSQHWPFRLRGGPQPTQARLLGPENPKTLESNRHLKNS
jgi:hypothetical protein